MVAFGEAPDELSFKTKVVEISHLQYLKTRPSIWREQLFLGP
jgi:hypothetical protein